MAEATSGRKAATGPAPRRGGMRRIGAELPHLAGPILGKQGIGEAQLVAQWAAIVGPGFAERCWPIRLSFGRGERQLGTLRLRVAAAAALELQHQEPILVERINGYFGYRAIARLQLVQGPPPLGEAPAPAPPRPLAPHEGAALHDRLAAIADPDLRAALERLGRAVIGTAR